MESVIKIRPNNRNLAKIGKNIGQFTSLSKYVLLFQVALNRHKTALFELHDNRLLGSQEV